jgi:plasmid stability protein
MNEPMNDVLSISVPNGIKRVVRVRAARVGKTMSKYARDLFLECLPPLTDDERVFLAEGAQKSEHSGQES